MECGLDSRRRSGRRLERVESLASLLRSRLRRRLLHREGCEYSAVRDASDWAGARSGCSVRWRREWERRDMVASTATRRSLRMLLHMGRLLASLEAVDLWPQSPLHTTLVCNRHVYAGVAVPSGLPSADAMSNRVLRSTVEVCFAFSMTSKGQRHSRKDSFAPSALLREGLRQAFLATGSTCSKQL